jgi:hypothetical protein
MSSTDEKKVTNNNNDMKDDEVKEKDEDEITYEQMQVTKIFLSFFPSSVFLVSSLALHLLPLVHSFCL